MGISKAPSIGAANADVTSVRKKYIHNEFKQCTYSEILLLDLEHRVWRLIVIPVKKCAHVRDI